MNRLSIALLLALLLLDTGYSFVQHLHVALDGDMAAIILPAEHYQQVMQDPFGLGALRGEKYGAPNRFFVHWAMSAYFRQVPLWLQNFVGPVDSIYLACALAKMAIQLILTALLAAFIQWNGGFRWRYWLLAAALVTPFFQSFGHNLQMGLIEKSITYTFFYPLPLALLLGFFLPFYRAACQGWELGFSVWKHLPLLGLAVVLPFSGPLVPALVLLACPAVLLKNWWGNLGKLPSQPFARRATKAVQAMPGTLLFYFLLISSLSLWSLYVGTFNDENGGQAAPLDARYLALLKGCGSLFTQKLGLPLLVLGIAANAFLISKNAAPATRQWLFLVGKWLAVFTIAYLLLLPLGGYRSYRPLIVRHDTVMPVTLCLVFFYGLTAFCLLRKIAWKHRPWYAWGAVVFSLMLSAADLPDFRHNSCEKAALVAIGQSTDAVVKLETDCPVLSWAKIARPRDSELNARLLKVWGVTEEVRLYYSE